MTRVFTLLFRPMVAGLVAAVAVVLIHPPSQTVLTEKVVLRDPVTPQVIHEFQVVNRTINTCDTGTIIRAINEVLRSRAQTGEAATDNDARAKAKGDAAASVAQSGVARSGDVNLGQIIEALAVCGTVNINAHNTVTDSEGRSGDAEVNNEADVEASVGSPTSTSQAPPPLPEGDEPEAANEDDDPDTDSSLDGS